MAADISGVHIAFNAYVPTGENTSDGVVFYLRSADAGSSFGELVDLTATQKTEPGHSFIEASGLSMATDRSGGIHIGWGESHSLESSGGCFGTRWAYSRDGGGAFEFASFDSLGQAYETALAVAPNYDVHLLWTSPNRVEDAGQQCGQTGEPQAAQSSESYASAPADPEEAIQHLLASVACEGEESSAVGSLTHPYERQARIAGPLLHVVGCVAAEARI